MVIDLKSVIERSFERVYCVNLDDRSDRWGEFQEETSKYNLTDTVVRFPAVKAKPGYVGCKKSHCNIIQQAAKDSLNNVLIFEDDAQFIDSNVSNVMPALEQARDIEWDMLFFGCNIYSPGVNPKLQRVSDNLIRTRFAYTTHAYAVHSRVYDMILEGNKTNNNQQIDNFYGHTLIPNIRTYIIAPMICTQRASYSDIENKHANYSWMVDIFNRYISKLDSQQT